MTRLAVAGDSVGGNMAAALTLMARDRSGPTLAAQVLFYPVTTLRVTHAADAAIRHEIAFLRQRLARELVRLAIGP